MGYAVTAQKIAHVASGQTQALYSHADDIVDVSKIVINSVCELEDLRHQHHELNEAVWLAKAEGRRIPAEAQETLSTLNNAEWAYYNKTVFKSVIDIAEADARDEEVHRRVVKSSKEILNAFESILCEIHGENPIESSIKIEGAEIGDTSLVMRIKVARGSNELGPDILQRLANQFEPIVSNIAGAKVELGVYQEEDRRMFRRHIDNFGQIEKEIGATGPWLQRALAKSLALFVYPPKEIHFQDCLRIDLFAK